MFAAYRETEPLFSEVDYDIVRDAIYGMSDRDFKIIYLRYWENHSILEIARLLRMSWDAVDRRLRQAMALAKKRCLSHPQFRRTPSDPIERLLAALQLQ